MSFVNPYDDSKVATLTATAGRDNGKTFRINEVQPVVMMGFVLRLLAALRLTDIDDLMGLLRPAAVDDEARDATIAAFFRVMAGCDPQAVAALVKDALGYVEVAADPKHPTAFRALTDNDIREMSTLGDVLGRFVRINLTSDG